MLISCWWRWEAPVRRNGSMPMWGPQDARLVITVGALFDFVAEAFPRAPKFLRRMRLEWFFRLAVEPRRMWRRYVLGNPLFLFYVLWHKLSGRARENVADTSLRTGTS
ncbi:WecB/TagA/CpsF family glycosyltransferase [Ensifer adhaerens]|uniref:WecB/TagA/CpsF family glycosyltransferase n=1 Tax=Ensifer adhaerens TaxID=106592 RepID=UPI002E0D88A5|nr:WecB/TagA/CpsF family glycosyltransferase [Ensifer adhaerens]